MLFTPSRFKTYTAICFALFNVLPIFAQRPVITSFFPHSGAAGTTVTISGNNFSAALAGNTIYFGAVQASVITATTNTLTVTVPLGATCKPISITTNNLIAWTAQPFIPTFADGGDALSAYSFAASINVPTGMYPYGVVIVDLDNDGKPDLATANNANSPSSTISILRNTSNTGTISFAPQATFPAPAGSTPYSIATEDIDGDGKKDLVVANNGASNVSVYRNTSTPGNIDLTTRIDFATGSSPYSVAIGDLDGDGKPDLAVTNFLDNSVSLHRNTSTPGNISFAGRVSLTTALTPHTVTIGDLDGDGKPDMAVTNSLSKCVSLFRNQSTNGTLAFAAKVDFITGADKPFGIGINDLDNDGKPDLVISNNSINNVNESSISLVILRNTSTTGAFSFGAKQEYGTGDTRHLTIGDLNGDGKSDIATTNLDSGPIVYQNTSVSGFISFSTGLSFYSYGAYYPAIGDLDADGKPDLAVTNFLSSNVSVFKNKQTEPVIKSFSPTIAGPGATVTITGGNFTNVTAVTLGGVPVNSFSVQDPGTITAVVGEGASGNVSVTTAKGTTITPGFTFVPLPVVTSFTPTSGTTGTTVTITGTDFTGASAVSFGGTQAAVFTVNSATSITATVNTGATGSIAVTTSGGTGTRTGFTFTGPLITAFAPTSGGVGTTVTITGTLFNGATAVFLGSEPASSFTVVNNNTITAIVGPGGASGSISVVTPAGTGERFGFTHTGPVINSFTPSIAGVGTVVTINGANFTQATEVSFGETSTPFIVHSNNKITATIETGSSGKVRVTGPGGTAEKPGFIFTNAVLLDSFAPSSGPIGSSVLIHGTNFSPAPSDNIVYFGPIRANVTAATRNTLQVTVPAGANYEPLSVTANGNTSYAKQPFAVTFDGEALNAYSFAAAMNLSVERNPYSVQGGDLDGDSKTDLVALNFNSNTISIFRNTSTIGQPAFAQRTDSIVAENPRDLVIVDFDGDGKLDIGILWYGFSVLRNTSIPASISYAPKVDLPCGTQPEDIAAGDLDGDGKVDVAITNHNTSTVTILRNVSTNGNISFIPGVVLSAGNGVRGVVLSDLNGDGKLDVAVTNTSSNSISVFQNTGTSGVISFAAKVDYPTYAKPWYVAAGDLDADGKPELVVSNNDNDCIAVYKNTSAGGAISLATRMPFLTGYYPRGVTIGEVDGDGKPDIIVANDMGSAVSVFRNTTTSAVISLARVDFATKSQSQRVFSGDLDGDGKPELAVANYSGTVSVLRNRITEPVIQSFLPVTAAAGSSITITGINFTNIVEVRFGGTPAASFTVVSPNTITAVVGEGSTGDICVITSDLTAVIAGFTYLAPPTITAEGPVSICNGSSVVLRSSAAYNNQWYKDGITISGATGNSLTVDKSGTYTVTTIYNATVSLPSKGVAVTVSPVPPKPVITWDATLGMTSSAITGNQWYTDTTAVIAGADKQSYKPGSPGYFAVKVTLNSCSSPFSDQYYFLPTSTTDLEEPGSYLKLTPNPVIDFLNITYHVTGLYQLRMDLTDMNGRALSGKTNVRSGDKINMTKLPGGTYIIRFYDQNRKINIAIPIVKQ